jgi:5-methylcytosine-specific restriction endonuclease McrA
MSQVLVIDTNKRPCDPVHSALARKLLTAGRAAVWRRYPFTIILKEVRTGDPRPLRLKLDPGSKTTGIAVVNDVTGHVVWAAELTRRGEQIRNALRIRQAVRRSRRQRKTRYRPIRGLNRRRSPGWLAPSLEHRLLTTLTWVRRIRSWTPIAAVSIELVRFDTQLMQNAEINGVEYQQGTLVGYEVREYLLEKWNRGCAYCGATGVPLEIEHLLPRGRGGSNRVSNLTLACKPCNQRKGNRTATEHGYPQLQISARQSLRDAAAINSTRWALYGCLRAMGLPIEVGTGGRTKYNRTQRNLPKSHWLDAACVGESTPVALKTGSVQPLLIRASGHGSRQQCRTNASGFPIRHKPRAKRYAFAGTRWQTGDVVRAVIPSGKAQGIHIGRIKLRFRPSFVLNGYDVHPKYLTRLQYADGYNYTLRKEEAKSSAG